MLDVIFWGIKRPIMHWNIKARSEQYEWSNPNHNPNHYTLSIGYGITGLCPINMNILVIDRGWQTSIDNNISEEKDRKGCTSDENVTVFQWGKLALITTMCAYCN